MLNLSIMTACIPILNRFFADLRTGMMGFGVTEPLELNSSEKKTPGNTYASKFGTGFGSKLASRIGVRSQVSKNNMSMSRTSGSGDDIEDLKYGYGAGQHPPSQGNKAVVDRSESVKRLTGTDNVIVQTVDYKVEYEEGALERHHDTQGNASRHSSPSGDGEGIVVREI